jgi:tripartite-type tricarboxylate transporter receptor subunit TctC
MKLTRREMLAHGAVAGGAMVAQMPRSLLAADEYPSRRVTIINQFAPGSISDAAARLIAQSLQDQFGQPFIVENRVGAGGLLAATMVARALPDGYTLLATASSLHSGAALYKDLPIDPMKDFTHIARIGSYPSFIAVRSNLPINSIQELVAHAKKNPGKLTYGHGNNMGQMIGETFKRRTATDIARVAYRSNPAAMTDLIAGHIDIMLPDLNTGMPHVQSGRVRPLAVFTKKRSTTLPDVPTLDETVMPGFDVLPWGGLSGPANLPPDVVNKLETAVQKALAEPETQKRFAMSGIEVFWGGQKEFESYVRSQLENWTALIREVGIQPQ